MTTIAITGATGRMGQMLIQAVLNCPDLKLGAALDQTTSPMLGQDCGLMLGKKTDILISDDLEKAMLQCDVLIDFTRPEGTLKHLEICRRLGKKIIIGTTGFDDEGKAKIAQAAQDIAIVWSANMSVGVNVTLKLLELATQYLHEDFDIEVFEAHHKHKVDAPSGTALAMGETIAHSMQQNLSNIADWARHGHTGARKRGNIGFSVMRGGDIVGDHTVYFAGEGERIEITHRSSSRVTYAQGSMKAARFLMGKNKGVYNMQQVLGLSE